MQNDANISECFHLIRPASWKRNLQGEKSQTKFTMHAQVETGMESQNIDKKSHRSMSKYSFGCDRQLVPQLKPLSIKQFLSITINLHIIKKVETNQTADCNYLLFHICFLLSIAEILCIYKTRQKYLFIYKLFKREIQKINFLSILKPKQLEENECMDAIICALRYSSEKGGKNVILQRLSNFLNKHQAKMKGLMPCYFAYFKLVVDKQQLLSSSPRLKQVQNLIETVQKQFQPYYSSNL